MTPTVNPPPLFGLQGRGWVGPPPGTSLSVRFQARASREIEPLPFGHFQRLTMLDCACTPLGLVGRGRLIGFAFRHH
jgi:hypothetical protein